MASSLGDASGAAASWILRYVDPVAGTTHLDEIQATKGRIAPAAWPHGQQFSCTKEPPSGVLSTTIVPDGVARIAKHGVDVRTLNVQGHAVPNLIMTGECPPYAPAQSAVVTLLEDAATLTVGTQKWWTGYYDATGTFQSLCGPPRTKPFADLKFKAPSVIQKMGYAAEAGVCIKLAAASIKSKSCSKATVAAAKALDRAARAVLASQAPIAKLTQVRTDAMSARAALEQEWETSFAALKRGARAADDEGAGGLFAALFQRTAAKPPSRPRKPGAPQGGTGAPTGTAPTTAG